MAQAQANRIDLGGGSELVDERFAGEATRYRPRGAQVTGPQGGEVVLQPGNCLQQHALISDGVDFAAAAEAVDHPLLGGLMAHLLGSEPGIGVGGPGKASMDEVPGLNPPAAVDIGACKQELGWSLGVLSVFVMPLPQHSYRLADRTRH